MSKESTPVEAEIDTAAPSESKESVPSQTPAPEKKSDIQRLAESKDKWKQEAIEARRLLEEKKEAEKNMALEKMKENEQYKELLEQREAELEELKKVKEKADLRLQAIEEAQEAELQVFLEEIPEDKRPPLDDKDSVQKRLAQVKYVKTLIAPTLKPALGGVPAKQTESAAARLKELRQKERPSQDELFEMMELSRSEES